MTSTGVPEPTDSEPIQFDRAEFTTRSTGSVLCTSCSRPVAGTYYELQGRVLCEECVQKIDAHLLSGSKTARFLKAAGFGSAAAVGGAIIMYLFRAMTGWELGLISILAGYMVGSAVRQGTGYRGGRIYQFLALFLTYSAVSWSYVPEVGKMFWNLAKDEAPAAVPAKPVAANAGRGAPVLTKGEAAPVPKDSAPAKKAGAEAKDWPSVSRIVLSVVVLGAVVVIAAYCYTPFYIVSTMPQGIISLLILFWGLQQAWQLTRKVSLDIRGPFQVGGPGPAQPEVPSHA